MGPGIMRRLGRSDFRRRCGFCLGSRQLREGSSDYGGRTPALMRQSYAALKRRSCTLLSSSVVTITSLFYVTALLRILVRLSRLVGLILHRVEISDTG